MKKNLHLFFITMLIAAGSHYVYCQTRTIVISGRVMDAETKKPLPFAHILLPKGSLGTTSNQEGNFIFKIPEKWRNDTLLISSVGYNTAKRSLSQLHDDVLISLSPASTTLKEITVNPVSGFDILKKALARIPENYDTGTTRLTAFYQEDIWLGDEELAFNEAVLDIIKFFRTGKEVNDQIRVLKGRKKKTLHSYDPQLYHWIGNFSNGARSSLAEDLIKYRDSKLNPFNPKNFRYYDCEYTESIQQSDRNLMVLELRPKKNARKGYLQMKIYVDEASLAIIQYDFQFTPAGVRFVNKHQRGGLAFHIMSAIARATIEFSHLTTSVTYKEHNGKWVINHVRRDWEALVNSKKRNMTNTLWTANLHLIVTGVLSDSVSRFTEGNIGDNKASMQHLIGDEYDEAFWENYNFLKPLVPDSLVKSHKDTVAANTAAAPVFTVAGSVTDARTKEKLAYANITVKGKSIGTVTNAEGEFILHVPVQYSNDSLQVSYIGYESITQSIREISSKNPVAIELDQNAMLLNEVKVMAAHLTAKDVIKEAIRKIAQNYGGAPSVLQGFLRDWKKVDFQREDPDISYDQSEDMGLLLEAAVNIYDAGEYGSRKPSDDKVYIKEIRRSVLPENKGWNYSNIMEGLLKQNHIKYLNTKEFPDTDRVLHFPNKFSYMFDEAHSSDKHLVINASMPGSPLTYRFYINPSGYAIEQIDRFSATPFTRGDWIIENINNTQRFREWNGRWYLSYWKKYRRIRKVNPATKETFREEEYFTALLINDVIPSESTPSPGRLMDPKKPLEFQSSTYNEEFWQNYNIIQDNPLDTGIVAFLGKHKKHHTPFQAATAEHTIKQDPNASYREHGFTRADTLRGKLTPLRSCYDVTFYHLDVAVDLEKRSVTGSNLIRFKVMQPFRQMQIDLYANMKIKNILYNGIPLSYSRESDAVFILLPEELKKDNEAEIKVYYEGTPKEPDWSIPMNGGLLWDKDEEGNPWVQVVCQGSGASLWWPNKDHLSDEPDSMKIWVTVPAGFTEISNGRLMRKTPVPGNRLRYEWYVSYPINNYNVTFNIGRYSHFKDVYISVDTLTIDYYVMPYNRERSKVLFRQVKPMLKCFEKYFGPYPFPRDGFTVVESLYPMEHQSGVCIGRITDANSGETNPLLWHESAHEWWGNAISCRDMADLWIHEAFATYAESLVVEFNYGKEQAVDVLNEARSRVRNKKPVIGVYDVNHIFYDIEDMYSKGALILNTFRHVLDNDTFWFNLLRSIQQRFRYSTLNSAELIDFINDQTGKDYTYFFHQYLLHPRLPQLEFELTEQGKNLVLKYRWKADVTNFNMPVKVTVSTNDFGFIYPSPTWQSLILRNMEAQEFAVDEDHFYIDINEIDL